MNKIKLSFYLNGKHVEAETMPNLTLLDLLRVNFGITSVKKGCEEGECGTCTVLLDGDPVTSCLILAPQAQDRQVTTIEGLEEHPLMKELCNSFIENGAVQCGFCTPGQLITGYALLKDNTHPSIDDVKYGLEGNLCRCTGYVKIIEAIMDTAERMAVE